MKRLTRWLLAAPIVATALIAVYLTAPPAPHRYGDIIPAPPTAATILGVYNVRDYGAKGNGIADDTAAIQAAINAVQTAGGGTVYLPPGTYLQNSAITVAGPNVNIVGAGAWATTIVTANTSGNAWTISGQGSISGFSIGPKVTRAVGVYEFAFRNAAAYRISDIDIRPQGGGMGWGAFDFSGAQMQSTNFIHMVTGVQMFRFLNIDNCIDLYVSQCVNVVTTTNGTPGAMIAIEGTQIVGAITISDSDFVSNAGGNTCILHISNPAAFANKFCNMYFDSAPVGAIIDNGIQADFTGCWFGTNSGGGVVINGGTNTHLVGGQSYNAGSRCVYVNGGHGHLVQGFSFTGNSSPYSLTAAIEVSSSCSGCRILGNNAETADSGGISIPIGLLIGSGATNVLVDQNDFHRATTPITNNASGTASVKIGTNL